MDRPVTDVDRQVSVLETDADRQVSVQETDVDRRVTTRDHQQSGYQAGSLAIDFSLWW